ncbi:MAG: addiction module toxin RelE [Kosakonia cowanii]|nr:addiction module toxin RelE [Kosakonia cowanii]
MGKSKRARLPFRSDYTKTFVKAWERYNKAGRRDMHETAAIMSMVCSPATRFPPTITIML